MWVPGERPSRRSLRAEYVACLLFTLLFIVIAVMYYTRTQFTEGAVTQTGDAPACSRTAEWLLSNIDNDVKPCDNFYQFACGNFLKNAVIPEFKQSMSVSTELASEIEAELQQFIEDLEDEELLPKPFRSIKYLYKLCMDTERLRKEGVKEAQELFRKAGGWPILDSYSSSGNWSFQETEEKLKALLLEGNSLLNLSFSSLNMFEVTKPNMILPVRVLIKGENDPNVTEYYRYMVDMAAMYGASGDEVNTTMKEVLDFEIDFAALLNSRQDNSFSSDYEMDSLSQLPSMNWIKWPDLLKSVVPEHLVWDGTRTVHIQDPEYIGVLHDFLKNKNRVLVSNYMFWRAADSLAPVVSEEMLDRYMEYRGHRPQPPWRRCVQLVSRNINVGVSSLYVKKNVVLGLKQYGEQMVEDIRSEMVEHMQETPEMEMDAKKKAVDELKEVVAHIAYPEELLNMSALEVYYKNLSMSNNSFLQAVLDVSRWNRDIKLFQNVSKFEWSKFADSTSIQTSFSVEDKYIVVSMGLLRPPLFSPRLPFYLNYGSIGYLVAHHLSHALHYRFPEKKSLLGGNITYMGGLEIAYRAYQKRSEQLGEPEPVLPQLKQYTYSQLFMLSMANMMCTKYRPEDLMKDGTSPIENKVNFVVKQSRAFNEAFKCN